jgi:phenylalanine-4-hydroxylase
VVAFGRGRLPARGPFALELATGLRLSGFHVGEGEVLGLEGWLGGRALPLPGAALLEVAEALPSVGGGPADPAAWDEWFGDLETAAPGDGEARARAHRAAALPPALAALYAEARRLREAGTPAAARLAALRRAAVAWPEEWLLAEELSELEAA